ncbi:hypothetical protein KM043_008534 [Ampulex compressa]|nr:hypothetical protein KM043_008534 [Ampulex compressa]
MNYLYQIYTFPRPGASTRGTSRCVRSYPGPTRCQESEEDIEARRKPPERDGASERVKPPSDTAKGRAAKEARSSRVSRTRLWCPRGKEKPAKGSRGISPFFSPARKRDDGRGATEETLYPFRVVRSNEGVSVFVRSSDGSEYTGLEEW